MGLVHPSWAVLPGVTVEATNSPLVEGSRSATTNETGRYSSVNLRPGTYAVTLTLPGWELAEENL